MNPVDRLFRLNKETIGRKDYIIANGVALIIYIVVHSIFLGTGVVAVTGIAVLPVVLAFALAIYIPWRSSLLRLRDIKKNEHMAWLVFVPIFGIGFMLWLCFKKGNSISHVMNLSK